MKLKLLRTSNDLTQDEIAKKLGMSQEKYNRLENGVSKLPSDILIKIANLFEVSADFILDRPFNNNVGYIPEDRKDLVKEIIEMSADEVKQLKTYIRGYKYGKGESKELKVFDD